MMAIKSWMFLVWAAAPVQFASAQFVDLNAEIQVSDWYANDVKTWTTTMHCVVGTNSWQMDGDFSGNARVTYWFTGTNVVEESVITKDVSKEMSHLNRPGWPYMSAPAIGARSAQAFDSVDGNPGRTVRQMDRLTMVARIAWLAFCSGPCIKQGGHRLFPPSDLWKELVCTDHFVSRTATFQDTLGLPKTLDLYTTNGQTVVQYRVTSSTIVLDWRFPLAFELAQYRPGPVPGQNVTTGTNGWELEFIAKGKVAAVKIGTAPQVSSEALRELGNIGK